MSDEEVDVLLKNIDVIKLSDKDAQEVVGYFEALDVISESYSDIRISEGDIKNLHNILLKHSTKDKWYKGNYKQHSNALEATYPDGKSEVIFRTTAPGADTETAMQNLIDWHNEEQSVHLLVKFEKYSGIADAEASGSSGR